MQYLMICIAGLLLLAGCTIAPRNSPTAPIFVRPWLTNTVEGATASLPAVDIFAFGPIGIGRSMSEGESAFRTILTSTNAVPIFVMTMTNSTSAAGLYAFCGIYLLMRGSFHEYAEQLRSVNSDVITMSGCTMRREKTSAVFERIIGGVYEKEIRASRPSGDFSK